MMKLIICLISILSSTQAFAITVWNYSVEDSGPINGGKVKIIHEVQTETTRDVRFKYKLQTVIGYKEDWIRYTLPLEIFDAKYLVAQQVGKAVELKDFTFTRTNARTFVLKNKDGKIEFTTPNETSVPWNKIKLKVGRVEILGTLKDITEE